MGATHFLMKTLPRVAGEMAVHVLDHPYHDYLRTGPVDRSTADIGVEV